MQLKKAEKQAVEDLKSVEAEREVLDKEKAELDAEEAELAAEEEEYVTPLGPVIRELT